MLAIIAEQSGMDVDAARDAISTMSFPTVEEQLSDAWLGGTAAPFMKGVADVFVEAGSIDSALDSYEGTVNTAPLASIAPAGDMVSISVPAGMADAVNAFVKYLKSE
jgi:taurine transport system substrate-binding protein